MKVCIAQFSVVRGVPESNLAKINAFVRRAKALGAELICLPEMCTTGFNWEKNIELLESAVEHLNAIVEMARSSNIAICASFLEKTASGEAANCFCYIDSFGNIINRYRKIHLFTLFDEEKHSVAGKDCKSFDTVHGCFGAGICYDLRFPELFRSLTHQGTQLIFLPSAFANPRLEHWRILLRARAIENQCFILASNQCGIEDYGGNIGEVEYFGHSMAIDPWGVILAESDKKEDLIEVEIEFDLVDQTRSKLTSWEDRRTDLFRF
jgi:predicted amidohydrolase